MLCFGKKAYNYYAFFPTPLTVNELCLNHARLRMVIVMVGMMMRMMMMIAMEIALLLMMIFTADVKAV